MAGHNMLFKFTSVTQGKGQQIYKLTIFCVALVQTLKTVIYHNDQNCLDDNPLFNTNSAAFISKADLNSAVHLIDGFMQVHS